MKNISVRDENSADIVELITGKRPLVVLDPAWIWDFNNDRNIITPKEDKTITMTIRIDRTLQEKYSELADKTNRSRNELIGMALQYALDNMELKDM